MKDFTFDRQISLAGKLDGASRAQGQSPLVFAVVRINVAFVLSITKAATLVRDHESGFPLHVQKKSVVCSCPFVFPFRIRVSEMVSV